MQVSVYKLADYKIIEHDTGELRWEAHFGLGELQEGRCFKKGTILFIGPAESKRAGFLILEFVDHLNAFPDWSKTKHFCRGLEVYNCKSGKKVSKEEMSLWIFDRRIDEADGHCSKKSRQCCNDSLTRRATEDVAFRIQRFEIIKN